MTKIAKIAPRSFLGEKTSKYQGYIDSLRECQVDQTRVFAAAVADQWEKWWREAYNLQLVGGSLCIGRLKRSRCNHSEMLACVPPGTDHGSLWKVRGASIACFFVSQPYELSHGTIKEMLDFADDQNLDFWVDSSSFYFPSQTIRIVWHLSGLDLYKMRQK